MKQSKQKGAAALSLVLAAVIGISLVPGASASLDGGNFTVRSVSDGGAFEALYGAAGSEAPGSGSEDPGSQRIIGPFTGFQTAYSSGNVFCSSGEDITLRANGSGTISLAAHIYEPNPVEVSGEGTAELTVTPTYNPHGGTTPYRLYWSAESSVDVRGITFELSGNGSCSTPTLNVGANQAMVDLHCVSDESIIVRATGGVGSTLELQRPQFEQDGGEAPPQITDFDGSLEQSFAITGEADETTFGNYGFLLRSYSSALTPEFTVQTDGCDVQQGPM